MKTKRRYSVERFDQPSFRVGDLVIHSSDKCIGMVTYVECMHPSTGDIVSVLFGDGILEEVRIYYLEHV